MTDRILDRMSGEDREALRRVCERLGGRPGDLDVEKVFAAVELLGERDQLEVSPFVGRWREEALRWDCDFYSELGERMVAEMRNLIATTHKRVSYLDPLVRWAADPARATVATLNYDRAIEVAGAGAGLEVHTGIGRWVQTGRWGWPATGLRLLKLHGSIDWVWEDDPPGRGRLPSRVVVQTEAWDDEARPPTVVFGARGKLRAEGPFLAALTEFEEQLGKADRLVVIGYSFRDDHVNQVVRRWTFDGAGRKIVIVDPGFPRHPARDGADAPFRDQLLSHLGAPRENRGTSLEVIRKDAREALPTLFPRLPR
ncbi:MAG TPA: SIR2 family protein [Solirubrobacterales bacterium]|nr:SIR2 family protein [Solirubrobacterales bacterium]